MGKCTCESTDGSHTSQCDLIPGCDCDSRPHEPDCSIMCASCGQTQLNHAPGCSAMLDVFGNPHGDI